MRKNFAAHRWPHRNIRFVNTPFIHGISICNDKAIIVAWKDAQVSFLIRSQAFVENVRDYFYLLWDQGKT